MASTIPTSLQGSNLGERHRYLNSLVTEAYNSGDPIENILESPECSPVDRLIKIDLASKHKHVAYILKNLKDDDMLYVSRALKSTWLLEEQYRYIIYPGHLEAALYPYMLTTAVNKMRHWIHLNLRDSARCLEFYKYYSTKDTDYALKFLSKCPEEIILGEFPKTGILVKITPQRLKVLCEKTPAVARLFYDMLSEGKMPESLVKSHFGNENKYFDNVKCILKTNIDTFLDIAEKHVLPGFKTLSSNSTKFIMTHRKDRFMQKPELYTARILNVSTLAQCLTPDECEDLVIKLARAIYLRDRHKPKKNWYYYKNVEPLLKRVHYTKRASFKTKVFIHKDVGKYVMKWPYDVPEQPELFSLIYVDNSVFLERKETYNFDGFRQPMKRLRLRGGGGDNFYHSPKNWKSVLDALFDQYRFSNFDKTLFELRPKLKRESTWQNRMYMFLVLVSKTGGRSENLDALFHLLMEFNNEPCQVRAAVIRSLVKRCSVWRVSEDVWKRFLIFGRGLGLDGKVPEADCAEGLHAVVIRALLSNDNIKHAVKWAFINKFSTFVDYSLTTSEKELIKTVLLKLLVKCADSHSTCIKGVPSTVIILGYAIDTLKAYKIKFETNPDLTATIRKLIKKKHVKNDAALVESFLERLYLLKLGRKELYRENFNLLQTDASYVNALKHDISVLSVDKFLKGVVSDELKTKQYLRRNNFYKHEVSDKLNAEQFLRKMCIYFNNGNEDLTTRFLIAIKKAKLHKSLARPISYLIGDELMSYILELDCKDDEHKRFSAIVRAHSHVARPAFKLDSLEWQKAGAKLIANRVIICKAIDIDVLIKRLLIWNRTAKLAFILAQRTSYEVNTFEAIAKIRPTMALKSALTYFRRQGKQPDLRICEIVKPLIVNVKANPHLVSNMRNVGSIPLSVWPEYLVEAFKVINKIDFDKSMNLLWRIKLILPEVDENLIEDVLKDFVENKLVLDNIPKVSFDFDHDKLVELYLSILGKYLLLCKTEDTQTRRLQNVGQLYLDRLQTFWDSKQPRAKNKFFHYIKVFSRALRCTEVFLSDEYVSCLPVMEKVVEWMRGVIPVETYFIAYVPFLLNMLYYKTIRQTVEEMPGVLEDKERRKEGYKFFGETFGKYVCQEARVLTQDYFDSIITLYRTGLCVFFNSFSEEIDKVMPHFIKSVMDASDGIECLLPVGIRHRISYIEYVFVPGIDDNVYDSEMDADEYEFIHNCFRQKNSVEMQFLYNNL